MFTRMDNSGVEDICYEDDHVEKVIAVIRKNIDEYFARFIETGAGNKVSMADFEMLQKKFGVDPAKANNKKAISGNYISIIKEAIDDFEKDREDYEKIFDQELLEDYDEDADVFKSKVLRNECPIIRKTLNNKKAKELEKYRGSFNRADADGLLQVVTNLCMFGNDYADNYNPDSYEEVETYSDLGMELLDTDEYTYYGVIGGGIKTHMLFKVHPGLFPNRSRNALWALWYLSGKESFGCKTDSEFLMIDVSKSITQQNYFYPYQLFAYYAFDIYKYLRDKANEMGAYIDPEYRYVIVDAFLDYVANEHDDEISFLKAQIRDGGMGFA